MHHGCILPYVVDIDDVSLSVLYLEDQHVRFKKHLMSYLLLGLNTIFLKSVPFFPKLKFTVP